MSQLKNVALILFALQSTACANLEFKGSGPFSKKSDTKASAAPEGQAAQPVADAVQVDASAEELTRLIAASGEQIKRSTGDLGIKAGCLPKISTVTSTVSALTNKLDFVGWGGSSSTGTGSDSTVTIKNRVVDASDCVADRLKSESFAFCQLKTSTTEMIECLNWSAVGGEAKKTSETACKNQADKSSGITVNQFGQRTEPKGANFFVCQKL